MKRLSTFMGKLALLMLGVCFFAACSDDDGPSYSTATVQNTELLSILKDAKYGLTFNENGNLLLDDAAKNITKLDLSGTKLSPAALSELSILPNLTDVDLSNNDYSISFDFSNLPSQITGVDLTGNELYEFPGLVNIETQENGDEKVTVLHPLTKLYLPETAKFNCVEIVAFYQNVSNVDMQIMDKSGALSAYNTLREIPDESLRTYLQENFSALFDNENAECINIANRFVKAGDESANLLIPASKKVKDLEGVQYVIMNPSYKGSQIGLRTAGSYTLPYLKIKSMITRLILSKVNTENMDLSEATSLVDVDIRYNSTIETLDLSNSKNFGQRGPSEDISGAVETSLTLRNCDNLKDIKYPQNAHYASMIYLYNLASLNKVDLSSFKGIATLTLGRMNSLQSLTYYTPDDWYGYLSSEVKGLVLMISTDIDERQETKTFLEKYGDHISKFNI